VAIDRLRRKKDLSSEDSDRHSDYSLQSPSLRKTKKKNANRKGPKRSKYQKRLDRQSQNLYRQGKTTEEGAKQSSGTLENAYKPKCPRCFRIFSSLLAFQYHDIRLAIYLFSSCMVGRKGCFGSGSAMWTLNLDPRGDNFGRSGCAFVIVVPGYQKMLRCRQGFGSALI
jgi:hypothetical protein